ncbi:MAG: hypothetical protein HXY46_08560 [Syntrophaceae bacterium]|nr:hypothetical protein [Syntrophaceae bacterium]
MGVYDGERSEVMRRKAWIGFSLLLFLSLLSFGFGAEVFKDCDSKGIDVNRLKERLLRLQRVSDEAMKGIRENDRLLMKAQDIIVMARAKGNVEAVRAAEEAARKAQDAIFIHKKKKQEADRMIEMIGKAIGEGENKNLKSLCEICREREKQLEQDKMVLKRYLKDMERTNREREERLKEIKGEIAELSMDVVSNVLPSVSEFLRTTAVDKLKIILSEEVLKKIKNPKITNRLRAACKAYEDALKRAEIWDKASLAVDSGRWFWTEMETINNNIEKGDRELKTMLSDPEFQVYLSESGEFGAGLILDRVKEILEEKHPGPLATNPRIGLINAISRGQIYAGLLETYSYHRFKLDLLEEEVDRDYELTDEQLKATEALITQSRRSMQKVKECQELLKTMNN